MFGLLHQNKCGLIAYSGEELPRLQPNRRHAVDAELHSQCAESPSASRPLRIACAGKGWYPESSGGLEKYGYGLARQLTGAGHAVDLFVTGNPTSWDERSQVFSLGASGHSWTKRMLTAERCFAKNYREPYDVANLHFAMYAFPLLRHLSAATPVVFNFQGPWALESAAEGDSALNVGIKRWIEHRVYERPDRFITLSGAFKEILHRSYGVPHDRIDVIPVGIDTDLFSPSVDRRSARDALGWPQDTFIVFTARRLVRRVGITELLAATAELRRRGDDVHVKIAGKGALQAEFQAAIGTMDLRRCVELLGYVSETELATAYCAADLTILPSQSLEGFGTIISESLACGTPVAGTPVGGIPEVLEAFSPQLIAKSPRAEDLADLLHRILIGELALPERAVCRSHALSHFSWPTVQRQVVSVFEEARKQRRRTVDARTDRRRLA